MSDEMAKVPRIATLDGFAELSERSGLFLKDILLQTIFEIRTKNSVYTLIVHNSVTGEVLMKGGEFLPELTTCIFSGSSFWGGSFLRQKWIGVGMCMEFRKSAEPTKPIITSPVLSISIVICTNSVVQ